MARRTTSDEMAAFLALGIDLNLDDRELLALLFTRHLWQLPVLEALPTSFVTHPPKLTAVRRPDDPSLEEQWLVFWNKRMKEIAAGLDGPPDEALTDPQVFVRWHEQQPPTWADRLPGYGIEMDSFGPWWSQVVTDAARANLKRLPEVDVLDDLRAARDRGLREIVVLPLDAAYAEWQELTTLLVSAATRNAPHEYAAALTRSPNST